MAKFEIPEGWTAQAYRFALDPSPAQVRAFRSHAGAARKAYNTMLALVKAVMGQRQAERSYGIAEADLTPALNWSLAGLRREWNRRKDEAAPWWAENKGGVQHRPGCPRPRARRVVEVEEGRAGRGRRVPGVQVCPVAPVGTFHHRGIRVEADRHHVTLPRLGRIRTHESTGKLARRIEAGTARVLSATLSEDSSGRWHVAFQVIVRRSASVPGHIGAGAPAVGVDVGVKDDSLLVIATPDGREIRRVPAPKSLTAAQARLRALQRRAARQQGPWDPETRTRRPPSKRWARTNRRIGRTHAHAAAVRRDVLHKETTSLAQRHQVITVETLNASGMRSAGGAYKKGLNLALSDAALAEIRRMLTYKCTWYGSPLVEAGRYFPSSKLVFGLRQAKAKPDAGRPDLRV